MIVQHHTPDGIILVDVPDPGHDRAMEICTSNPDVMTQLEIWELLRLLTYRLFGNPPG